MYVLLKVGDFIGDFSCCRAEELTQNARRQWQDPEAHATNCPCRQCCRVYQLAQVAWQDCDVLQYGDVVLPIMLFSPHYEILRLLTLYLACLDPPYSFVHNADYLERLSLSLVNKKPGFIH